MKIILDAMGGDYAPLEMVKGAVLAAEHYPQAQIVLCGDEEKIRAAAKEAGLSTDKVQVVHTAEVISMEDEPLSILKAKKNSSMGMGLQLLREDGDAFISAGNTGALHTGASLFVRCLPGVHRACIGTVLPFTVPVLLLDSGANAVIQPEYLAQWALTGSVYASRAVSYTHLDVYKRQEEHSVLTVPAGRASVNKAYASHGSIGFVRSCFALFYLQFPQKGEQFGSRPVRQRYF